MANSDCESSFYGEATDYRLEDDGNDGRPCTVRHAIRMPKIKKLLRPMTTMDCYHKLMGRDLRGKSKFRNGEYQYLLRIAAHSLSNFVSSHLGPIKQSVKAVQRVG